MRRIATVVLLLLLILLGAYSALWFVIAGRITDEIGQWAERERQRRFDVSWERLGVFGYPLAFRVTASEVRLRDLVPGRAAELRAPQVEATARPWNFRSWAIEVPGGLSAVAGPSESPRTRLTTRSVAGEVALDPESDVAVSLDLENPTIEAAVFDANGRIVAREAIISVSVPREPPRSHEEPALSLAVETYDLRLPNIPPPFHNALDELAFDLTVLGPVPNLPPRQAAETWRDAGGTIEIEKLAARAGDLAIDGSGTLALDRDLQPEASFSGAVQGYDKLIAGLAETGLMPRGGSGLARLGLSLLAQPGANGQPQVKTSFTIQNGEMTLGPLKLGRVPRIVWE